MENVIVDNINHFSKYLKPEDPLYPCDAAGTSYKATCYLMQTSYMLKVVNGDFKKVFDLCAKADAGYENICYQSLGRDASGRSISNVEATRTSCYLGSVETQRENCIIGAVKDFISYFHSDAQAKELCATLPAALREACFATAKEYVKVL